MSGAFAALEDRLLRGGIAPRHVRRYLRELTEHLADLTAAQRAAGFDDDDAQARARAALGPDAELADAMLQSRDFRSITARFPWLVFGVAPPLAAILGFVLWVLMMVALGVKTGAIQPDHRGTLPAPAWYATTAGGMMFAANFLIVPLLGALLAWLAQRQRMTLVWPLLGMALLLWLGIHGQFDADTRRISVGVATLLPLYPEKGPFGPRGLVDWPTLMGQGVLLCLPAAWLLRAQRKMAA